MSEELAQEPIEITVSAIIDDLSKGIVRKKGDKGYVASRGSIQEKYALTSGEVTELFKHRKLAGLKVKVPSRLIITDDVPDKVAKVETPAKFGEATAAAIERIEAKEEPTSTDTVEDIVANTVTSTPVEGIPTEV